ncbi:MAG: hypothetical protein ACYCO3_14440 [Mycobacteriales bacterium]
MFTIERTVTNLDGSPRWAETAYGVSSLTADRADATTLLRYNRRHWGQVMWTDGCLMKSQSQAKELAALASPPRHLFRLIRHRTV